MSRTMKIFRQLTWCRYLCWLSAVWLVFVFFIVSFLKHEPDLTVSNKVSHVMKEVQALKRRDFEKMNLLIDYSPGLNEEERGKFKKRLKQISKNSGIDHGLLHILNESLDKAFPILYLTNFVCVEPSEEYENLRRRIYSNVLEMWYYVTSQVTQFKPKSLMASSDLEKYNNFMSMVSQYKRSLLNDIDSLANTDGFTEWRKSENEELSNLVQRRLKYLQNPKTCKTAKKLVCDLNKGCGYGCQLHHVVYCFIVAYGSERTMVLKSKGWRYSRPGWEKVFLPVSDTCTTAEGTSQAPWPGGPNIQVVTLPIIDSLYPRPDFLPLSVPEDLARRIRRIHGDPIVWWVGQFLKYLLRPQAKVVRMLDEYKEKLGFKKPIVGIHIRRTDKVGTEADFHKLSEYMYHVEEYFKTLEMVEPVRQKRVYIATDEPKIFEEARTSYPDYEVIGDVSIAKSAAVNNRYSEDSLSGIITDIHLLSLTDFLVCTFSSQVCRAAYEIMNNLRNDAAYRYRSLDDIYYYGGQKGRYHKVVIAHIPAKPEEIELQIGDEISVAGNHWNGFSKGTNLRTYKTGLYPTFKVVPKVDTASFPLYNQVEMDQSEF